MSDVTWDMDKRQQQQQRSTGHYQYSEASLSKEQGRSSKHNSKPKRIANNEAFLDASRDPRLSHEKYRGQMMTSKSRVSPDTTVSLDSQDFNEGSVVKIVFNFQMAALKKSSRSESASVASNEDVISCSFCPDSRSLGKSKMQDHLFRQHREACFSCGLCPSQASAIFETMERIRGHLAEEHSIDPDMKEIVDKLIKLPTAKNSLSTFKCAACARYDFLSCIIYDNS